MTEQSSEPPAAEAKPEPLKLDVPLYDYVEKGANSQPRHETPVPDQGANE